MNMKILTDGLRRLIWTDRTAGTGHVARVAGHTSPPVGVPACHPEKRRRPMRVYVLKVKGDER